MRGGEVENIPAKRRDKIKAAVGDFDRLVSDAVASHPGLDLLALLDQAGQAPSKDTAPLLIISSGVSTVDPLDMRQLGWVRDPAAVVQDLRDQQLLPRHLQDRSVTFFGLGEAAGTQSRLPPPDQKYLEELWLLICEAAGAAECTVTQRPPTGAPLAEQPVPGVPVTGIDTVTGVTDSPAGGCTTVVRVPAQVLFTANSADLQPAARGVLQDLAGSVTVNTTIDEIAGHVANFGPDDGLGLSQRRAQVVTDQLVALGVPRTAIRAVTGYGDGQPVTPNFNADGTFNEELAAQNRRVEITMTAENCTGERNKR